MNDPLSASSTTFAIDVEAGKRYYWCACGKCKKPPFCDGSHRDTEFKPIKFVATESRKVFFCGCKQTNSQPLCDGSHNK